MSKSIEDTAQEITDMFFEAGGRIRKKHFDTVVAKFQERDRIAREEGIKHAINVAHDVFGDVDDFWEKMEELEKALTTPN